MSDDKTPAPFVPYTVRNQGRLVKPHKCEKCARRFTTDQGLSDHTRMKHGATP